MKGKKIIKQDQESLADVLFPQDEIEEFEEAILNIPPEKRILRTEQYDFSVASLISMMDKKDVVIPEFQRRYVWSDRQASRLVESLIIQCPIPVIYLNQEKDETFSVIDGNQRLRSLHRFLSDEFTLTGLTSYPELSGFTFSMLDVRFQRHISNRVLRCIAILKETHPQVKFDVFERLNSGAVALTRQELRHGLYYGPLLKAAGHVAKATKLESHLGSRRDKRMKAEELVIRFWALRNDLAEYEKPLAGFISAFAEKNRHLPDAEIKELTSDFERVFSRVETLFGRTSFSHTRQGRTKFNAAVYDAHMLAVGRLSQASFEDLSQDPARVQAAYALLEKETEFVKSITLATSDKAALQGRVQRVSKLLKSL